MNEETLAETIKSILNPMLEKHIAFSKDVVDTIEQAFLAGVEVGKKLNK